MAEEWRVIPSTPAYEASDHGRIRRVAATRRNPAGHIMRLGVGPDGRQRVRLCIDGQAKTLPVHRLVLEAFVGPRPSKHHVCCHWNDIPTDNRLSNLRWGSYIDNSADSKRNGRQVKGERHHKAKFTDAEVHRIREQVKAGKTPQELAPWYCVTPQTITKIALRQTWRHI